MASALLSAALVLTLAGADDEPLPWSLRPVAEPAPPELEDDLWSRTDVDRFLLARMREAGLEPGPDAAPGELLRRLSFDLTGLPPSPAELADFVAQPSAAAFDAAVERMLASPRFGERWGRHWLDVARFAESSGGGRSLMFPDAWRYRDYVIEALDADVPFDQFVLEQLAGDLLGSTDSEQRNRELVATGFLVLGPTNYEQQDKELLRLDVIDEQIDLVGRAFLGQSLSCARCHEHKFDPISSEDYYALAGIFGSTEVLTPGNVSGWTEAELGGPATERWHAHQAEVSALESELAALDGSGAPARLIERASLPGLVFDDSEATLIGEWKLSVHTPGYLDAGYLHDQDQAKGSQSATWTPDVPADGLYEVLLSHTPGSNRATNVPVVVEGADGRSEHSVNQRQRPPRAGWFTSLGTHRLERGMSTVITVGTAGTDGHVIVDALQLVPAQELVEVERELAEVDARAAELTARLEELRANAPEAPPRAMAVRERPQPRDEHVRLRGSAREFGELVSRRAPAFCAPASSSVSASSSGRIELARWIVDPTNPLTARVQVNRVWQLLFGRGLVGTPDNFGAKGEAPTHPALLDHLAGEYVRDGWSTKRLIARLVRSRAYGLASGAPPSSDPQNLLRARAPLRRLDADALRDAILFASGELDLSRGGRTIQKLTQYDHGYEFDSLRRSCYVPRFRNSVLDLFQVFDGPNQNTVTGRRGESQVPTQALFLMNSPWLSARAEAAARRVLAAAETREERLRLACISTLGRAPLDTERALFDARLGEAPELADWSAVLHALLASLDLRYLR